VRRACGRTPSDARIPPSSSITGIAPGARGGGTSIPAGGPGTGRVPSPCRGVRAGSPCLYSLCSPRSGLLASGQAAALSLSTKLGGFVSTACCRFLLPWGYGSSDPDTPLRACSTRFTVAGTSHTSGRVTRPTCCGRCDPGLALIGLRRRVRTGSCTLRADGHHPGALRYRVFLVPRRCFSSVASSVWSQRSACSAPVHSAELYEGASRVYIAGSVLHVLALAAVSRARATARDEISNPKADRADAVLFLSTPGHRIFYVFPPTPRRWRSGPDHFATFHRVRGRPLGMSHGAHITLYGLFLVSRLPRDRQPTIGNAKRGGEPSRSRMSFRYGADRAFPPPRGDLPGFHPKARSPVLLDRLVVRAHPSAVLLGLGLPSTSERVRDVRTGI